MQEILRKRIDQLKSQLKQAENMKEVATKEVSIFTGRLNEATDCLNYFIELERKAQAEKEAEKLAKQKKSKKAKASTQSSTDETTVTNDLAQQEAA